MRLTLPDRLTDSNSPQALLRIWRTRRAVRVDIKQKAWHQLFSAKYSIKMYPEVV